MTQWSIPEYLDAHPTASYASVIALFVPTAPPESADKLDAWYTGRYNLLADNITAYEEALAAGETPDNSLKMALAQWAAANIDEEKPALPENPVTPTDPADPLNQITAAAPSSDSNGGGSNSGNPWGNIRNFTTIGTVWVAADIISMTTTMAVGYDEGNEQATCSVVLHNKGLMYSKLVADFTWCPRVTRIWSMVEVVIHDPKTTAETINNYMFFQGFMSDAKVNHETVTIEFGCISIEAAGAYNDENWSPEDGYITKMKDIVKRIEDGVDQKFPVLNVKLNKNPLIKQAFAPSDMSGGENLRSMAQDNGETFYFAQDMEDNMYVVLYDTNSKIADMTLEPYVLEPGDTSNIFGHSNQITVVGGPTDPSKFMRHVATSIKDEVFAVKNNKESQRKYGVSPMYIKHELNLPPSQIDIAADIIDENFKSYEDRDIKVTVVNKIPKLLTVISFRVIDVSSGEQRIITAGVKKKQVEYSASGVISHLEAARLKPLMAAEEEAANNDDVVTETPLFPDGTGTDWQYNYENGQWVITTSTGVSLPQTYTGNIPDNVAAHFAPILSAIEASNDAASSTWRSL